MMQDQIKLNFSLDKLRIKCYVCNMVGHLANQCNLVHYKADNEKIIKKYEYSHPQERKLYARKKSKHKKFKVFEEIKIMESITNNINNNDGPIEKDFLSENADQESEFEFNEINDSSSIIAEKKNSNNNLDLSIEKRKSKFTEVIKACERSSFLGENLVEQQPPKTRISSSKIIEENNKRVSIAVKDHETMIEKIILKKQNDEEKIHTKLNNENEFNENCLWKLWSFDTVHNFTKYFPMYNCKQIAKENNKFQNPYYFNFKRKKRKLIKKYSEYTFFPDLMYEKINYKKEKKIPINDTLNMENTKKNIYLFGEFFFKLIPIIKRRKKNLKHK